MSAVTAGAAWLHGGLGAGVRGAPLLSRQEDFADVLGTAERRPPARAATAEQARDAAERFVASTLVQPILDQVRASSDAAPPFQMTRAERQFAGMLDARIAMDIVRSSRFEVVDRVARGLLRGDERGGGASGERA